MAETKKITPFKLYAYCLMPNHIHLLIEAEENPISTILHRILSRYSRFFNFCRNRRGHLFQGRYKAILCSKNIYLLGLLRYIHLNPFKARLVGTPSQWPWSSHRTYLGNSPQPIVDQDFPLSLFHERRNRAVKIYSAFIQMGMDHEITSTEYSEDKKTKITKTGTFTSSDRAPQKKKFNSLEDACRETAVRTGTTQEDIRSSRRLRALTPARRLFMTLALADGFSTSEVAVYLGRSPSAIYKTIS